MALALAVRKLMVEEKLAENPLLNAVAAVSVGLVAGEAMLDLCYVEDVAAAVDMNIVMNASDEFIEVQGTGEEATFTRDQLDRLLEFGRHGIRQLLEAQNRALAEASAPTVRQRPIPIAPAALEDFHQRCAEAEDALVEALDRDFRRATFGLYRYGETHDCCFNLRHQSSQHGIACVFVKGWLQEIRAAGLNAGSGRIAIRRIARENWAESWKRHFKPLEISSRLLVIPSWSGRKPKRGQTVVILKILA